MLSDSFYQYLANLMYNAIQGGNALYIAIGSGEEQWDTQPPALDRSNLAFENELARLPCNS